MEALDAFGQRNEHCCDRMLLWHKVCFIKETEDKILWVLKLVTHQRQKYVV